MRVGASGTNAAAAAQQAHDVEPRRTAVSQGDLRAAIGRAHVKVTGKAASAATLDVLTAQASLETASGSSMFNYNFGGIKGASPSGETAKLRTHEILNGKDVEIRDGFRAYKNIDEGAADYVRLMRDRFPGAMAQAERGDVNGFAHALKQSHYYTADEGAYASGLRGLMSSASSATSTTNASQGAAAAIGALPALPNTSSVLAGTSPADGFVDASQLSRVLDSIGHHRTVIEPEDDD